MTTEVGRNLKISASISQVLLNPDTEIVKEIMDYVKSPSRKDLDHNLLKESG